MRKKDQVRSTLVQAQCRIESSIRHTFRARGGEQEAGANEPIKWLVVNDATIRRGTLPLCFGPHEPAGLWHPMIVIDVTPDEFEQAQRKKPTLPNGWELAEEMHRPTAE